jgi:hypothetical protein
VPETAPEQAPAVAETVPEQAPAVAETVPEQAPVVAETVPEQAPAVAETVPDQTPVVVETVPERAAVAEPTPTAERTVLDMLQPAAKRIEPKKTPVTTEMTVTPEKTEGSKLSFKMASGGFSAGKFGGSLVKQPAASKPAVEKAEPTAPASSVPTVTVSEPESAASVGKEPSVGSSEPPQVAAADAEPVLPEKSEPTVRVVEKVEESAAPDKEETRAIPSEKPLQAQPPHFPPAPSGGGTAAAPKSWGQSGDSRIRDLWPSTKPDKVEGPAASSEEKAAQPSEEKPPPPEPGKSWPSISPFAPPDTAGGNTTPASKAWTPGGESHLKGLWGAPAGSLAKPTTGWGKSVDSSEYGHTKSQWDWGLKKL